MRGGFTLVVLLFFLAVSPTYAWLVGWDYRKPIEVNTTTNVTDYQLLINVSYEANMEIDFADIRFTDLNDNLYVYWVESKVDSLWANIWVKGNFTTNNGTQMYVYYGNPNATQLNNSRCDVFSACWENGMDLTTVDYFSNKGATITLDTNNDLRFYDSTQNGDYNMFRLTNSLSTYSSGGVEIWMRGKAVETAEPKDRGASMGIYKDASNYFNWQDKYNTGNVLKMAGWTVTTISADSNMLRDTWYNYHAIVNGTDWINYRDTTTGYHGTLNTNVYSNSLKLLGVMHETGGTGVVDARYNYYYARSFVDPEPTTSVGAEKHLEFYSEIVSPTNGTYHLINMTANVSIYANYTTNYTLSVFLNSNEVYSENGSTIPDTTKYILVNLSLYDGAFTLVSQFNDTINKINFKDTVEFVNELYNVTLNTVTKNWYYNQINYTYNATCWYSSGNMTIGEYENDSQYNNLTINCPSSNLINRTHTSSQEGNRTITIAMFKTQPSERDKNQTFWYISDLFSPQLDLWNTLSTGVVSDLNETLYFQQNDTTSPNATCYIGINGVINSQVTNNSTQYSYNFQLNDSVNSFTFNCTDLAGNYNSTSISTTIYSKTINLVDEDTGDPFDVSKSNITMSIPELQFFYDFTTSGKNSIYLIQNQTGTVQIKQAIDGIADLVIRNLDLDVMPQTTDVCANDDQDGSFAEQILYSTTTREVFFKNIKTDCYLVAGKTKFAYENALKTYTHTKDELYYLYITLDGSQLYLSAIDGSNPTVIDLDILSYNTLDSPTAKNGEEFSISAYDNTTVSIYYENVDGDNTQLEIKISNNGNELSDITSSDPNKFEQVFDYSTLSVSGTIFKVEFIITKNTGTTKTVTKYVSASGTSGILPKEFAIFTAVAILLASLTMVSTGDAIGWFGMLASVVSFFVLSLAPYEWQTSLMFAIGWIILVFIWLVR